jgi:general secretion pathway protein D
MKRVAGATLARAVLAVLCTTLVGGCFRPLQQSDGGHLSRQDARNEPGAIPPPVGVSAALPRPKPTQKAETFSVVVNNVRVQDLLFALARDAKLNVDIYPGITGTVTLNAIDQTLPQVLSRIAKQVDMRYELDGPNLVVMPDSPYLKVYKVDYVNMERSATGTVTVSGQITGQIAGAGGGGGGGGATGAANTSTVSVRNTSVNRFWDALIDNIGDILRETDKVLPATPLGNLAQQQAQAQAQAQASGGGGGPAPMPPAPTVAYREAASVIANREAGVLSIRATSRQHEKIQEFLDQVLNSARRQVLIEATIVEVILSTQYQQGIDWSIMRQGAAGFNIMQAPLGQGLNATPTGSIFTLAYTSANFAAAVRLLETFGNVRTLSSPRISAVNNQTALLKVVDNKVYFTIQAQVSQAANVGTLQTFTTTPNVVPVGLVMNITPNISDNEVVLLNLKPTLSRITGFVNDPNPVLRTVSPPIVSQIPEIQTREIESVIKVGSGDIVVMGGLIQDSANNNEDLIPGVNRIPGFGNLFGNRKLESVKTELVIFIRPTVIKDASLEGDFRGYREFLPGDDFMSEPNPARRGPRGQVLRP